MNQAQEKGQDTSIVLALPVIEITYQKVNRVGQYQTLEFKVIKELERAVTQYRPTAPFTQYLVVDTVMNTKLTLQDWKTICKATFSGGNFLLWSFEWCETSNAGNLDWNINKLLRKGQYEGNDNQVGLPVEVFSQIAMAAHHAWNQLPTKEVLSGNLLGIKQAPDEQFQKFVDRLQKAAGRNFGDP